MNTSLLDNNSDEERLIEKDILNKIIFAKHKAHRKTWLSVFRTSKKDRERLSQFPKTQIMARPYSDSPAKKHKQYVSDIERTISFDTKEKQDIEREKQQKTSIIKFEQVDREKIVQEYEEEEQEGEEYRSNDMVNKTHTLALTTGMDQQANQSESKTYIKEAHVEYSYRWVVFTVYILSCLTQALSMNAFTPIGPTIEEIYGISPNLVTLPALMFMLISPPTMLPVNYISDRFGIRVGTACGGVLLIIGTGIKLFINQSFYFTIIGNTICGIGNSFITNCPTKVASNWFKPCNRTFISILLTIGLLLSPTLGVLIPPFFINDKSGKSDVFDLMLFEFAVTAVISILLLVLFKEFPPTPPSFTAQRQKLAFGPQLKMLFTNKVYYLLMITMAFNMGAFGGFVTVLSFFMKPYGIGSQEVSIFVLSASIIGLISSFSAGIYIRISRKLKKTVITGLCFVVAMFALSHLALELSAPVAVMALSYGILGGSTSPVTPALIELAAEICYPVAESTITGFLFAAAQIVGFVLGEIASMIVDGKSKTNSQIGFGIFLGVFIISLTAISFIKEDFKRTREEVKKSIFVDKKFSKLDQIEISEINEQLVEEGVL